MVRPGDLVILDRDENPKAYLESFQTLGAQVLTTHVRNLEDLHRELGQIAEVFSRDQDQDVTKTIRALRQRVKQVMQLKPTCRLPILRSLGSDWSANAQTALVIWQQKPSPEAKGTADINGSPQGDPTHSWMLASTEVFLGDVFWRLTGNKLWSPSGAEFDEQNGRPATYPQVTGFPQGTQILLVTEPFPFWKNFESWAQILMAQGARGVYLIDGEAMSWFGIRSLRALEDLLES
jgi:hypothetical protein